MTLLAPSFALAGMAVAIVAHVVASRAGAGIVWSYIWSLIAGFLATALPCSMALMWNTFSGWAVLTALLLFGSWWFIFLNIAQAMESSIRVQLVRELLASGGSLPYAQLLDRYNDEGLVRLRLQRLVAGGTVIQREGRLFLQSRPTYLLARFFRLLKVALFGKRSEFLLEATCE
jgi:hypothetical protein